MVLTDMVRHPAIRRVVPPLTAAGIFLGGLAACGAGRMPSEATRQRHALERISKKPIEITGAITTQTFDYLENILKEKNDLENALVMNQELIDYLRNKAGADERTKVIDIVRKASDRGKTLSGLAALYDATINGRGRLKNDATRMTFVDYLNGNGDKLDLDDYELIYRFGKMVKTKKRMQALPVEEVIEESVKGLIFEPGYYELELPKNQSEVYNRKGLVDCKTPTFKIAINLEGHPMVFDRDPKSFNGSKGHIFWANYNESVNGSTGHVVPVFYATEEKSMAEKWFKGDGLYYSGDGYNIAIKSNSITDIKGPFESKGTLAMHLQNKRNSLNDHPNLEFKDYDIWSVKRVLSKWNPNGVKDFSYLYNRN